LTSEVVVDVERRRIVRGAASSEVVVGAVVDTYV